MSLNRRRFMHIVGAGAGLSLGGCSEAPEEAAAPVVSLFSEPLGFQLYTLRYMLAQGVGDIFERAAAAGYTEIEAVQSTNVDGTVVAWDDIAAAVRSAGLTPVSSHVSAPVILGVAGIDDRDRNDLFVFALLVFHAENADRAGLDDAARKCRRPRHH